MRFECTLIFKIFNFPEFLQCLSWLTLKHADKHIHIYIYMYIFTHTYIYVYIHIYTHSFVNLYIYTYLYICIQIYRHTIQFAKPGLNAECGSTDWRLKLRQFAEECALLQGCQIRLANFSLCNRRSSIGDLRSVMSDWLGILRSR